MQINEVIFHLRNLNRKPLSCLFLRTCTLFDCYSFIQHAHPNFFMKILFHYLKPHKWLVTLVLILAAINIGFSLMDPIILGRLINLATYHTDPHFSHWHDFLFAKAAITEKIPKINKKGVVEVAIKTKFLYGMVWLLLASITVAMISRIAKNFQDYFLNAVIQ